MKKILCTLFFLFWIPFSHAESDEMMEWFDMNDERPVEQIISDAEKGDPFSAWVLGWMYNDGRSEYLEGDAYKSLQWYLISAEQGYAPSQFQIGQFFLNGGEPTQKLSVKWFLKAAEQGYGRAQSTLALLYEEGTLVPQDYLKAYMWASLAAIQQTQPGEEVDTSYQDGIAENMTPSQIASAKRMVSAWQTKHPKTKIGKKTKATE